MGKLLGGWTMSLQDRPLHEFDYIMYGMVTNLSGLTTGTPACQGWSPEKQSGQKDKTGFTGKQLWVYGGGGCFPQAKPANMEEVRRIVSATVNKNWDGVDFDDECNMNTNFVIETMTKLKENHKDSSFGFIAGHTYNHPQSEKGKNITDKVQAIIKSGQCNRLIHYCYAAAMWDKNDILANVRPALEKSISYGIEREKIILALTYKGLTDWNLNYFLDQIIDLNLGGLFIWRYNEISPDHLKIIKKRLHK